MTAPAWTPEMEERAKELLEEATPGPWMVDPGPRLGGAINALVDGCWRQVADASGQAAGFDPRKDRTSVAVQRANAKLIAAAPELVGAALAEIERLRTVLEDKRTTEGAIKVHLGLAAGGTGESLEEEVRKVVAERDRLALDLAEMALAARPGPTAAEMDAADKASGRRRAIAKRRK